MELPQLPPARRLLLSGALRAEQCRRLDERTSRLLRAPELTQCAAFEEQAARGLELVAADLLQGLLRVRERGRGIALEERQPTALGSYVREVGGRRELCEKRLGAVQMVTRFIDVGRVGLEADERIGVVELGHTTPVVGLLHQDAGPCGELERLVPLSGLGEDPAR